MATDSLFMNAPDHVDVPAGHVIYSEGDSGEHMYGIVDGKVALTKGRTVIAVLGPNDVFGERALIDHLPRNVTAVATADTSSWCTSPRRSPWGSWAPSPAACGPTTNWWPRPPSRLPTGRDARRQGVAWSASHRAKSARGAMSR